MGEIARKWIHQGGIARLAYSRDGTHLFTAGGESFVRVFSGDPAHNDDDSVHTIDHKEDGGPVLCLDSSMESLVVGYEDGTVELLDIASGSYQVTALLTRSNLGLAIRAVKFSPNGQRVAVASDETSAKIIDVRDTKKIQVLEGHSRGIRSLTWSPDGHFVTTSSSDGTIRVFDVSNMAAHEPTCIQVIDGVIAAEEPECEMQCEAIWHPTGKYFVVGSKAHEIAVISRQTWQREGLFEKDGHNSDITTLTFSPNGRYLCSSGRDEAVLVWECATRRVILRGQNGSGLVASLAWRPGAGANTISYIDNQGNLARWDDVIAEDLAHPNDAPAAGAASKSAAAAGNTAAGRAGEKASRRQELDNDDLDLDIGGNDGAEVLDDEDDFIEDDDDDAVYQSRRARHADDDDLDLPPALGTKSKGGSSAYVSVSTGSSRGSSLVKGQEPFQPGSTPLKEKRRYLAFNMLGVIHVVERETHNIVAVDFHDQSAHARVHFDDFAKYSLASLGSQGAVYASASKDLGSAIAFKPFEAWGASQGDWAVDLPMGELVTALAIGGNAKPMQRHEADEDDSLDDNPAGSGTVVVATSKNYLRFFSGAGVQIYLLNFGEEVVSLAAGKEWLFVVHRASDLVQPGCQNLSYTMLDLDTHEVVQRGKLPLAKHATLSWIGFAEDQMPYMYDSTGLVSALSRSRRPMQGRWVPMLDTQLLSRRETKDEAYWAVGVSASNFMCIILKGQERHPFFPTPITQDLALQVPLLKLSESSGEAEARYVQMEVLHTHARDSLPGPSELHTSQAQAAKAQVAGYELEMDKSVLKLIQLACKNDRPQQALELARAVNSAQALNGAVRIAQTYGLKSLEVLLEDLVALREGRGGAGYRERREKRKREGKYAHLVDDRTITDSSLALGDLKANSANGNLLDMPFSHNASRREKKTARNVFSDSTPAKPQHQQQRLVSETPQSRILQGAGAGSDDDEPVSFEPEETEDSFHVSRSRLDSVAFEESTPASIASSAPKTRMNPFAKRPQPPKGAVSADSSGTHNPFSKRTGGGLHKSDSFFERVDASNGIPSAAGSGAGKQKSRQSTLFGSKPTLPAAGEAGKAAGGRGRKRKSDAAAAGADLDGESQGEEAKKSKKEARKLDSFFGRGDVSAPKKTAAVSEVSEDAADIDETEETLAATQEEEEDAEMNASATLEEEGNSTSTMNEESEAITPAENADENDGMSKLAAFRKPFIADAPNLDPASVSQDLVLTASP